jgi:hypothetical protein
MDYNTRMLALKPLFYGGRHLQPGDEFHATPIDADYLTRRLQAEEGVEILEAATPARRGRPRKKPVDTVHVALVTGTIEPIPLEVLLAGNAAALGTQEDVTRESSGPVEEATPQADFTPHFNPPPD